ncbi:MAG: hypothetical protein EA361_08085 [Bacteroidetes bacterium]|nr:MAG: hypothetical protein EA361_08085 [Bacteroidota bacterium]
MEMFKNILDRRRFKTINCLWNELMLNDSWSIGYVESLIDSRLFERKEEWEEFYYDSGEDRNHKIANLVPHLSHKLNDDMLLYNNRNEIMLMSKEIVNLNYNFGRTHDQLTQKAVILFQVAVNRSLDITIQESIEAVRFNTICKTWNEVIIRERNTISYLI